jgi:hypothetical protein
VVRFVAALVAFSFVAPAASEARLASPSLVRAPALSRGLYTAHLRVPMAYPRTSRHGTIDIRLQVSRDGTRLVTESWVALDVPCPPSVDALALWNLDTTGVPEEPGEVRLRSDVSFSTVGRVEYEGGGVAATLGMEGRFSFTQVSGWLRHRSFSVSGKVTCATGLVHWKARLRRTG